MSNLIKHYQNDMKNIPQLTNNWGSMIKLLDKVLVEGFNFVPILSITKSSIEAITATITLGAGHGFIDRQVVRIGGSTNGWDGDFKVLSANTDSVVIECLSSHPLAITGTASCSTAPLDFEIVFSTPSDRTEPKRAYRSTSPESLGLILLVHDFCVSGAAVNGAKFAKVGVVSSMSDIDNITGNQMPYDPQNTNANWGWDGTYHGWTKWYYRTYSNGGSSSDSANASTGNSAFNLVGDGKSFVLDTTHADYGAYAVYGFCEFYDQKIKGMNLVLLASGSQLKVPQAYQYFYSWARGSYHLCNEAGSESVSGAGLKLNALIWFDENGVAKWSRAGRNFTFGTLDESQQFALVNFDFISTLPILDVNNSPRGVLPFLRISANQKTEISYSTGVGKYVNKYTAGEARKFVKYTVLLESL